MQLYMQQKVFSWKDRFSVMDSLGRERYTVEGKIISLGKKLHIYDQQGNEVAFVKQKLVTLMPKFTIEMNGQDVAEIVKKFTLFKPKYFVKGPNWEVQGNLMSHDYTVLSGNIPIVAIHKKWVSWGDAFELDIPDEKNEVLALAVVLAIDAVMDAQQNAASFSSD